MHTTVCRHCPLAFLSAKGGVWTYEREVLSLPVQTYRRYDSSRETLARKKLLSTFKVKAATEGRVALKPCVSLWAIPRHLTADTVSCKQLPTVATRATCLSKVDNSYFRANVSLLERSCE